MSLQRPTLQITLDTRGTSERIDYPLKLRVTFRRITRLYSLGYRLTELDFKKLQSSSLRDLNLRKIREHTSLELNRAKSISQELCNSGEFDFNDFKTKYLGIETIQKKQTLLDYFIAYSLELKNEGRISTHLNYECSRKSLEQFKQGFSFKDANPKTLEAYELYMVNSNKSVTTISMYLRCLRAILNQAIEDGNFDKMAYPFSKRRYQIPASRNIKKALEKAEIDLILNYKTEEYSNKDKARDFWVLSYLCNGINMKDILNLKLENVEVDKIRVVRAKTKRSLKADQKTLDIYLHPLARTIINKWNVPYGKPKDYLFDILRKGLTPKREREILQNFTQLVNKNMAKVAKELAIEKNVTTYSARHSFGTVLKRSGVSTEYISEALGHSNLKTTELYLDSFDEKQKENVSKFLV
jgi:integrase/recombinase XerD